MRAIASFFLRTLPYIILVKGCGSKGTCCEMYALQESRQFIGDQWTRRIYKEGSILTIRDQLCSMSPGCADK
jgi:hypothetical protein